MFANNGTSVLDYMIASTALFSKFTTSLNIFYCIFGKGVGLQVLSTLVTARPLQHIYNSKHGIHTINKL